MPVATIDRLLEPLLTHGRVPQGYLGIAVQPVRTTLDGAGVDGLLVSSVAADGPAARGGLLVGDIVVSLGGKPAASLEALRDLLRVGEQVLAVVVRGGRPPRADARRHPAAGFALRLTPMARIVVVSAAPLLADGVAAALRGVDGWDVRIGAVDDARRRLGAARQRAGRARCSRRRARTCRPTAGAQPAARSGRRGARRAVGARGALVFGATPSASR